MDGRQTLPWVTSRSPHNGQSSAATGPGATTAASVTDNGSLQVPRGVQQDS
jgi:hypothetical protein